MHMHVRDFVVFVTFIKFLGCASTMIYLFVFLIIDGREACY